MTQYTPTTPRGYEQPDDQGRNTVKEEFERVHLGIESIDSDVQGISDAVDTIEATAVPMTGATDSVDGIAGYTPQPVAGDDVKLLTGAGTYNLVDTSNISDNAISTAKIQDSAISTAKIADDSISSVKINAGAITNTKISDNVVTTNKIISTSKTGTGSKLATSTGTLTNNNLVSWNSDGDAVDAGISITQARAGQLVGVSESTLGSDSTITATSATDSGLQVNYTAITATNDRYLDGIIDWEVSDTSGNKAEAFIELQYSSDGSSWSALKTFTRNFDQLSGSKEVKVTEATLGSDVSTSSTTSQTTGLSISYSPVAGSNIRYVELSIKHKTTDNDSGSSSIVELQYSTDNSSWSTLRDYIQNQGTGGATSSTQQLNIYDSYRHNASTATPYYRITHRANPSTGGGTSTVFTNSMMRVREFSTESITAHRTQLSFSIKHSADDPSPRYRLSHYVTSGDTSKIYSGSILRVKEISNV